MTNFERRKVLKAGGAGLTIGLAGCIGPFADRQGVPGTVDPNQGDDGDGGDGSDGSDGGPQAAVDEHLAEVSNYDGTIEDMTGEDSVTLQNGAIDGVEQQYAFDPPAIQVDPGTTVTWEWVGSDAHSVTEAEGTFDSGIQSGEGTTFEYTFEEEGTFLYYCQPHRALDQKGAIVVGEGGGGGGGGGGGNAEVEDHLSDANLYDGSIEDMTGQDSVSVVNGANSPDYAFDPAAIRISTGTEVTWEWAEDVSHSVTHDNGDAFDSGIQGGADTTFSYTFEEAGTYLYVCVPHEAIGQKGAVIVEE